MPENINKILGIIFLTLIALIAVVSLKPVQVARQAFTIHYTEVQGQILDLQPPARQEAIVEYAYNVDGQAYLKSQFSYVARDAIREYERLVGGKNVGDAITVYVHPGNHELSVLVSGWTRGTWHTLGWSSIVIFAWFAIVYQLLEFSRPSRAYKEKFLQRINISGDASVARLRMVPFNFTPVSAGIACFFAAGVIGTLGVFAGNWLQWWSVSWPVAVAIGLLIGTVGGVFDYHYTLAGNRRGRWDLIVDHRNGQLQTPAIGAWGEPCVFEIDSIIRLECTRINSKFADDGSFPVMALNIHFIENGIQKIQKAAESQNLAEMNALREWICEAIALPEEHDFPESQDVPVLA